MSAAWIIGGISLGLVSSLHCVGMCGPLALALPVQQLSRPVRNLSILSYQSGRVFTYSLLGMLAGVAGRGIYLAGFQQYFSIVMGVLVLLSLVLYYGYRHAWQPPWLSSIFQFVQRKTTRLLRSDKNIPGFLLLGMGNGLLPCGMVYVALATAVTAGSVEESVLFMALFGVGTLPAMLTLSYFGYLVPGRIRYHLRKASPVFMGIAGTMLILRGLGLNIPFLSPELPAIGSQTMHCGVF